MEILAIALYWLGACAIVASLIWSFVVICRESPVLAVVCLFLPMGLPIALLLKWPRTWKPLVAWGISLTIFFCSLAMKRVGE